MSELRMPGIFSVPSLPVLILLFLAAMTMPGCQSVNPFQGFGLEKRSPEENRIRKLMRWHSGKVEVYRDFRTVFSARAVFISDGVREALVDWQARTRLLDPGEKEDLHRSMFGEGGVRQVLVGFYTPDEDMNAIGGEEEPWIVFLERPDGTAARATCSEVLEDERDMYMRFLEWDLS